MHTMKSFIVNDQQCLCILYIQSASPACTELEVLMMDWLAKMLQLPQQFLSGGQGGGVIQVRHNLKNKHVYITKYFCMYVCMYIYIKMSIFAYKPIFQMF